MRLAAQLLLALVALVITGCTAAPSGASDVGPACDGKCDWNGFDAPPLRALIVVPLYEGKAEDESDTDWALEQASKAGHFLFQNGWTVHWYPTRSIDDLVAELDRLSVGGYRVDSLIIVGHGDQRGVYFDYDAGPGDSWLQAGWDWYGPGRVYANPAESGQADIEGVRQFTSRLESVVDPSGHIVFIGCRVGRLRFESEKPTPFTRPGGPYYESYAHVVADLSDRLVYASRIRDNLCFATESIASIYYGGPDGIGGLPDWFIRVARADLHRGHPLPGYPESCGSNLCTSYGPQHPRPSTCEGARLP